MNLLDNGASGQDVIKFASGVAFNKVLHAGEKQKAETVQIGKDAQKIAPQTLDPIFANDAWKPIKRYEIVQKDGVWYTVGESGSMFRAKGTYDYVTINGKIFVSRTSSKENVGHYDISQGASQVDYAGSVRFGWSKGTRGIIKEFDNSSGYYKPSSIYSNQSGLPLDKFKGHNDVK